MPIAGVGPVFEDAVGAQLLTAVIGLPSIIKERQDSVCFENHVYLRHDVRLVVDVDRLPTMWSESHRGVVPYPAWGSGVPHTGRGGVVVPLGDLDRHSRTTTHITDEAGDLVPLYTDSELNTMLAGGLVSFAAAVLPSLSPELIEHLRAIPATAAKNLQPGGANPRDASDRAFEQACEGLLKFGRNGLKLLQSLPFRTALAAITSAVHLVVEVDPRRGQKRVFSYSYTRPIPRRTIEVDGGLFRRWQASVARYLRYWGKAGSVTFNIDLGPIGGCERYQLTAEAPFDTWFSSARLYRGDIDSVAANDSDDIDLGQMFRINYTRNFLQSAWWGVLRVRLTVFYTGVTRASVYASGFLTVCAAAGLLRVVCQPEHMLIPKETDAAASLLLLFPGIAASAVAVIARNTLTATLQFPIRLTLWSMSIASFVLATAAAFRLKGMASLVLWSTMAAFFALAYLFLRVRARRWKAS